MFQTTPHFPHINIWHVSLYKHILENKIQRLINQLTFLQMFSSHLYMNERL